MPKHDAKELPRDNSLSLSMLAVAIFGMLYAAVHVWLPREQPVTIESQQEVGELVKVVVVSCIRGGPEIIQYWSRVETDHGHYRIRGKIYDWQQFVGTRVHLRKLTNGVNQLEFAGCFWPLDDGE